MRWFVVMCIIGCTLVSIKEDTAPTFDRRQPGKEIVLPNEDITLAKPREPKFASSG